MKKKRTSKWSEIRNTLFSSMSIITEDMRVVYAFCSDSNRRAELVVKIQKFFRLFFYRVTNEGVLKESAGLTYITILGFIPFVTFLVMIVPDLPFLNLVEKLKTLIAANFMPGSAEQLVAFMDETLKRRFSFNIFNFAILIVTSYSLFRAIRNTFDRILSMEIQAGGDILSHLIKFFGTLFFGMFIMILLFSSSSVPIISFFLKLGFFQKQLIYLIPFLMQFIALVFMYSIMPSIKTKRSSLIRGAFWTTLIWILAKSGFDFYIYNLTSIQAVYGVLAALPIFLMWIYINWIIILGGIVLVSVIDQGNNLEIVKKEPKQFVRITMEMYSDQKLNKRLEGFISKKDSKELSSIINTEEES